MRKVALIAGGCLLLSLSLSSCSTNTSMSNKSGYQRSMNGGLSSNALGERSGIYGQNYAGRLRAPANQSYYFAFDKSAIHKVDLASIDAQANYLVAHRQAKVLLAGNTDIRGSREYNVALGERRAQAVAERLRSDGVYSSQLKLISYGAEKPLALAHNEQAYAKNRRVDLTYLSR